MHIADRIRQLRMSRKLTQGDLEAKTGLLRCYISRVEHGHTVPSLPTLERIAAALEIPLYQFFCDENTHPRKIARNGSTGEDEGWATSQEGRKLLKELQSYLCELDDRHRMVLLRTAYLVVKSRHPRTEGRPPEQHR